MGARELGLPEGFEIDPELPDGFELDAERPKQMFDSSKPYFNIPAVLEEEFTKGHAPNAVDTFGRTGAAPLAVMGNPGLLTARTAGMAAPAADVVGSAGLGNAATASATAAVNRAGLLNAAKTAGRGLLTGAQKVAGWVERGSIPYLLYKSLKRD